jgi:hypothetical protein
MLSLSCRTDLQAYLAIMLQVFSHRQPDVSCYHNIFKSSHADIQLYHDIMPFPAVNRQPNIPCYHAISRVPRVLTHRHLIISRYHTISKCSQYHAFSKSSKTANIQFYHVISKVFAHSKTGLFIALVPKMSHTHTRRQTD